ncbi:hypothetical protein [Chromobacterium haemolyticum]|uniref:hypothetical protein n=1 Tax=Chromobacterium haemolyticum TaxID=394935 RepID=UPI00244C53D2|nr:hypothetical protein [Chromobacterium haemolyticum]MDH0342840.1 hypothetical protein [Chromobacterium haemolyticum]
MPPKPQNAQPPAPPEDAIIQTEPEQVAHQSEPASEPEASAEPALAPTEDVITVRVLSAVTIGDERYQPNTVLTLPAVLAQQHADALDDHPDAIAMALVDGGAERTHGVV